MSRRRGPIRVDDPMPRHPGAETGQGGPDLARSPSAQHARDIAVRQNLSRRDPSHQVQHLLGELRRDTPLAGIGHGYIVAPITATSTQVDGEVNAS